MRQDWNARSLENAEWYIASGIDAGDEAFWRSGVTDAGAFFTGLEHLLDPSADVLDIGCGIGRMDAVVAPKVRSLIGLDVSDEMVKKADARHAAIPNLTFVVGTGSDLSALGAFDPASGSFDLVFSYIVFQHVPKVVTLSYAREVLPRLRPGGSFVFHVPEASDGVQRAPADDDTFGMRLFTEDEIRPELGALGFEWCGAVRHVDQEAHPEFHHLRIHVCRPKG